MAAKKKSRELSSFGIFIKTELVKRGLSHEEFANEIGMKPSYLSNLLYNGNGTRSGHKYLPAIAELLGIDLGELYKLLVESKKLSKSA